MTTDSKIMSRLGLADLRDEKGTNEFEYLKEMVDKFESTDDESSEQEDDEDINYFDFDDEQEFESIFNRVCTKQKNSEQTLKITLKYLFKLLKFYKLEHYTNDLIDNGFLSPISLIKLKQNDLDTFNVSPYDKKKFVKLQLFLKQVTNTIKRTNTKTTTKANSKFSLNDDCIDLKMFSINEWKHLAYTSNQSSSTSSLNIKQTTPNEQLKKNIVEIKPQTDQTTPIWTQINPKEECEQKNMKRITKTTTSTFKKPISYRAKSIDPQSLVKRNPVPSRSSVSITPETNSVTHPVLNHASKSSSNFFGPKLSTNKEIASVELVNSKNYNYGVPQTLNTKNKGFIRKTVQIPSKANENQLVHVQPSLVTSEIFVFARKRPKLPSEIEYEDAILVDPVENSGDICVNEIKLAVDGTPVLRKNEFNFDKAFDSTFTNEDIFRNSILPFINAPFKNRTDFNCICFGQTGSGKTHTLFGNKQQDGLCVLTAESLFSNNERLFCGFYEIYNGQLYDLINRNNKLVLREDSSGLLNVVGLVEVEIKSIAQLRKTIEISQSNRHIGSTSFNKASSRSHAVIQFKVPNIQSNHSNSGQVIIKNSNYSGVKSKVNSGLHTNNSNPGKPFRVLFIDLAGSERGIDAQNNQNDNRKEGAEINQSLLALKECIRCIDQFRTHAPFRQSKLTRVLRDCFIGTGKTILLATVSPTDDCVSCSLNTLQYANRVRQMALRNRKKTDLETKKTISSNNKVVKKVDPPKQVNKPMVYQGYTNNQEIKKRTTEPTVSSVNKNRSKSVSNVKKTNVLDQASKKNFDDKKSLKYLINTASKNPASVAAAAVAAAVATVSATNVPTNNILQTKSLAKSSSNNGIKTSSLFHPSKINCSSTPIKSVNKIDDEYKHAEDMLFVHDTPIKGHKLKHMTKSSSQMLELAERYFDRVNSEQMNMKLVSKFTNRMSQQPLSLYSESNEIMNSKIYSKLNQSKQPIANDSNGTKNEDDESGVESDELNKSVDKRTKPNTEERLKLIYTVSPTPEDNNIEVTLNDENLNRLRKKQREMLETKKFLLNGDDSMNKDLSEFQDNSSSSVSFSRKYNDTSDHLKNALDSQNQLRTYIRNLENKLTNLRNEIKEQNVETDQQVRKNSTDSTDSLKDVKFSSNSRDVYTEFLQQRKHLEKQKENLENSKIRRNSKLFDNDDDIEKKFFENQLENSKSSSKGKESILTPDDTLYSDNDAFEKSIHKGKSMFAKSLKPLEVNQTEIGDTKCQFSPITQEENKDKIEPVMTPRTQLLNPIPIRLSSSSSSFESSFSLKNIQPKSDESENLSPRLKASNSKIWKSPSDSGRLKSSILMEVQKSEEIAADVSEKVQLITAHENQLSDLSETCQKEMNLILNLKDSKMDFKDYLSQMEEMLSKKVSSIRDLQNQISQLKTEITDKQESC